MRDRSGHRVHSNLPCMTLVALVLNSVRICECSHKKTSVSEQHQQDNKCCGDANNDASIPTKLVSSADKQGGGCSLK